MNQFQIKKTKGFQSKKIAALFLCIIILFSWLHSNPITSNAASANNKATLYFFNVHKKAPGEKEKKANYKGSASLIECTKLVNNKEAGKKYVLVDGGTAASYSYLKKKLKQTCKTKNRKGQIVLDYVILTHNHRDHYGGIVPLLQDKEFQVKNFIYTSIGNLSNLKPIKDALQNSSCPTKEPIPEHLMFETATEDQALPEQLSINGVTISLFYPPHDFTKDSKKGFQNAVNDSSLTVDVRASNVSCIILGDMFLRGLEELEKAYKSAWLPRYDICVYGHHGVRGIPNEKKLIRETTKYKQNFDAKAYIFSTSLTKINFNTNHQYKKQIRNNYITIVNELGANKVFITGEGNIKVNAATRIERFK